MTLLTYSPQGHKNSTVLDNNNNNKKIILKVYVMPGQRALNKM